MTDQKTSEIVITQVNRRIDNLDKRLTTKMERIEERLDTVVERGSEMLGTLKRNTESLEAHMRRTEANEKAIEEFKKFQYKVLGALLVLAPVATWALNHFAK
jgi:hypothetical protein